MKLFDILLADRPTYEAALQLTRAAGYMDRWEHVELPEVLRALERAEDFDPEAYSTPPQILEYLQTYFTNPENRRVSGSGNVHEGRVHVMETALSAS